MYSNVRKNFLMYIVISRILVSFIFTYLPIIFMPLSPIENHLSQNVYYNTNFKIRNNDISRFYKIEGKS